MVVSNDIFDDQLQACSGSIDPTSEPALSIRIKHAFRGLVRGMAHPVKPMEHGKR